MRFPEVELSTYLRVFTPEERVDALLDEVAAAAIEADVQDEVELYSLAHWLMDADERRTPELEAVVLVEEVGLPVEEVAIILDLDRDAVEAAVRDAWAEVSGDRLHPPPEAEPPAVQAAPAQQEDPEVVDPPRIRAGSADQGRRRLAAALGGALVVALLVLGIAVFSDAGQQRLLAQGLQPVLAFGLVVGLLAGGAALVRAGGGSAQQLPAAGEEHHQPDERG